MRNAPHRVLIYERRVVGEVDGAAVNTWSTDATWGRFGLLDARERTDWQAQDVTASVRVPHSADVGVGDRLVVSPAGVWIWQVETVRPNPAHVRMMLKRSEA